MKLLLSSLLLMVSTATFSQYADSSATRVVTDYLEKSKKQKTAGWILLGGGALMTTIGTVVLAKETEDLIINIFDPNPQPVKNDETLGSVFIVGGLLAMAGSIPFFIAAGRNRKKAAATVFLKMEKATIVNSWAVSPVSRYPALGIHVRL